MIIEPSSDKIIAHLEGSTTFVEDISMETEMVVRGRVTLEAPLSSLAN